jgi:peptide/nickel transport system permease protein
MTNYLLKRVIRGLITLLIAVSITFLILRLMPGDPTTIMLDPRMSEAARARLLQEFGLDKSLFVQYFLYLKQMLKGDLGQSFIYRTSVTQVILTRLPWTLLLMGLTQLFTMFIGVPLGVFAGYKKGSILDHLINAFTIFGISIFIPWLGITLLYFFGYQIPIFPIGGAYTPGAEGFTLFKDVVMHLVLPVFTLTLIYLANYVLYMRASMIDVLSEDYIRTARSKGVKEKQVVWKHAVRNALIPTVTMAGLLLGRMVSGAVLTETIFSFPGVGRMIYEAVGQQDFPVLQGAFLILAVSVITMNILTDLVYAYLDPRVKLN